MADFARAVLLAAHLLTTAAACAAPACAVWIVLRPKLRDRFVELPGRLVMAGIYALVAGALVGGASLSFFLATENQPYLDVLARIPAYDLSMLLSEWGFTLVLYGVMAWMSRGWIRRPRLFAVVGIIAVMNLAYHFPTIMTVIGAEANATTFVGDEPFNRAAFRERIVAPLPIARTLHFWALAVTVGGLLVALASRKEQLGDQGGPLTAMAARGMLVGLGLQAASGVLVLTISPASTSRAMTGENPLSTAALLAAVAMVLVGGFHLLRVAFISDERLQTTRLAVAITMTVLLMCVATLHSRPTISAKKPLDHFRDSQPEMAERQEDTLQGRTL